MPASLARSMVLRAVTCCTVAVRSERPRPTKLTAQCMSAEIAVLERGEEQQVDDQPRHPGQEAAEVARRPMLATARKREIVAMLPLSK